MPDPVVNTIAAFSAQAIAPLNWYPPNGAYVTGGVIKGGPGTVYGFSGYSVGAQFILVYDAVSVPVDGSLAAVVIITVPALSNFSYDPGLYGRYFSNGISWSRSSTAPARTVGAGGADVWLDCQFR